MRRNKALMGELLVQASFCGYQQASYRSWKVLKLKSDFPGLESRGIRRMSWWKVMEM